MQLAGLFWVVSVSSVIGLPLLGFPPKKTNFRESQTLCLKKFWDFGTGCLQVGRDACWWNGMPILISSKGGWVGGILIIVIAQALASRNQ